MVERPWFIFPCGQGHQYIPVSIHAKFYYTWHLSLGIGVCDAYLWASTSDIAYLQVLVKDKMCKAEPSDQLQSDYTMIVRSWTKGVCWYLTLGIYIFGFQNKMYARATTFKILTLFMNK